jgi:pyrroline-5-carboxylate reductase
MNITVIGTGNIGGAIVRGLCRGSVVSASDITCVDRSMPALEKLKEFDSSLKIMTNNVEAVRDADMVIIAVKPWGVAGVFDEIHEVLDYDKQMIVSVAAGVTFEQLTDMIIKSNGLNTIKPTLFRVIPNTAIEVLGSMTFVSSVNANAEKINTVVSLFDNLGKAMYVEERLMMAGTALASSGIAFAFRYIRAAIEGGVELGFYPNEAQEIVVNTVRGAVELLLANGSNPEQEIDRVTTPGGITIRGLNEMELSGFTSAVIRGLKASK